MRGKAYRAMQIAKLEKVILQGMRLKLRNPIWHDADMLISLCIDKLRFMQYWI